MSILKINLILGYIGILVLISSFSVRSAECSTIKTFIAPERGVVVEIHRKWMWRHWAGSLRSRTFSLDMESEFPKFTVNEPSLRAVWTYYLDLPVDFNRYPIAVLKYRCRNTHETSSNYVIWMDDGTGPDFGGISVFRSAELLPDGKIHELRKDLRKFNPKGAITCMALGVMCGDAPSANFELVTIGFEAPPDAPSAEPLQKDTPFSIRVVDQEGKPLESAKVIIDAERKNFAQWALTDKKGDCQITPLRNDAGKHMLRVEKEGMVPVEYDDIKNTETKPIKITLKRGLRCSGIVKDAEGDPVKGVTVSLLVSVDEKEKARLDNRYIDVLTDEKGSWQTPPIVADANRISVKLNHPNFISDEYYKNSIDVERFKKGAPIILTMEKGVNLFGRVNNENGEPVSRAEVVIGTSTCGMRPPITQTDKDGRFEFKSLPLGENVITIQHGGYAAHLERLTLNENSEINVALKKGRRLRGRIINKEGAPVNQAWIVSDGWKGCRTISLSQKTNEKGEFCFENAPEGTIEFDIMVSGYADKRKLSLIAREEPYEIILEKPLKISGKVIDAETDKPLSEFQIFTGILFREGERVYWESRSKTFEDKEGNFELTFTSPYYGRKLRASAKGYASGEHPQVFKVGEEIKDVVIALKKGNQLKGKIYSSQKRLLANAKVILGGQNASISVNGARVESSEGLFEETQTDADGIFLFDNLNEESYQLLVLHPEEGAKFISEITSGKEAWKIELEPYAKIEGFAYENEKPLAGCEISLYPYSISYLGSRQTFSFRSRTTTDQDGRWSFEKVMPGIYDISIMIKIPCGNVYRSYSRSRQRVTLMSGEKKFIVLGGIGGPALTGKVVDPEGKPVVGAEVSLRNISFRNFYYTTTQPDGTYKITEIEPGRYFAGFTLYEKESALSCGPGKVVMEGSKKIIVKPDFPKTKLDITLSKITTFSAGDVAPDFIAETLKGEKVSLSRLKGKPVFLDFWAIWCGPCVEEIPSVKNAYEKYKNEVIFIGVNLDSSRETLEKFVKKENMEWPQIFDGKGWEGELVKKYGVKGIPATFLIDRNGNIAAKDLRGEKIMQALEGLIKK